jgi:hypothetical protein
MRRELPMDATLPGREQEPRLPPLGGNGQDLLLKGL